MKSIKITSCRIGILILPLLFNFYITYGQSLKEKEVLTTFNKKFEWLKSKQSDSLKTILDNGLKYIHSNGWVQSKYEVIDDLQTGKLAYTNFDIGNTEVRVYSNSAIVTGRGKFSGVMSENTFEVELMFTEMYVLKNKKWTLVSRHANRMP